MFDTKTVGHNRSELDEHFGWPVQKAVEEVNSYFKKRLLTRFAITLAALLYWLQSALPHLVSSLAADRRPRLFLVINLSKRLPVVVAHDKTRLQLLDGPGRREAARRRHYS
jgi:hypothetical protein